MNEPKITALEIEMIMTLAEDWAYHAANYNFSNEDVYKAEIALRNFLTKLAGV